MAEIIQIRPPSEPPKDPKERLFDLHNNIRDEFCTLKCIHAAVENADNGNDTTGYSVTYATVAMRTCLDRLDELTNEIDAIRMALPNE